ncbi:MAG TPA: tetratricopeptide repeat protein, partial [Planctomycetota bacterium]|nr:tetratricopeptide repeat protein [Planctomycetota bacterium]
MTAMLLFLCASAQAVQEPVETPLQALAQWQSLRRSGDALRADAFLRTQRKRLFVMAQLDLYTRLVEISSGGPADYSGTEQILAVYDGLETRTAREDKQRTAIRSRREAIAKLSSETAIPITLALRRIQSMSGPVMREKPQEAEAAFAEGLKLVVQAEDRYAESVLRNLVGELLRATNRPREAMQSLNQAIELQAAAGDCAGGAITLLRAGQALTVLSEFRAAKAALERSIEFARDADDRSIESDAWEELGTLYMQFGQPGEALDRYKKALELRGPANRLLLLTNLAGAYRRSGEVEKGREIYDAVLAAATGPEDSEARISALVQMSVMQAEAGKFKEAAERGEEALEILDKQHLFGGRSALEGNVAQYRWNLGEYDRAKARFERALNCTREEGNREAEAWILGQWGGLLLLRPDGLADATAKLSQSVAITESVREQMGMLEQE